MTNKHFILDRDALADEAVRRYLATRAYLFPLLDLDEGSDFALVTNGATIQVD
jgi:hypothetical protein